MALNPRLPTRVGKSRGLPRTPPQKADQEQQAGETACVMGALCPDLSHGACLLRLLLPCNSCWSKLEREREED